MKVKSAQEIEAAIDMGQNNRTVASTKMNAVSSRSHAMVTLKLTGITIDPATKLAGEKVSSSRWVCQL